MLRKFAPAGLSGLTAELTSCISFSRLTAWPIAVAYLGAVSAAPALAWKTSGLLPYACSGKLSSSSSVAEVEPVPGRVRLSLVLLSPVCPARTRPTARTIQAPIVSQ